MKLVEMYREFIHSRELKGLSADTVKSYQACLNPFIVYMSDLPLNRDSMDGYIACVMNRDIAKATKSTYVRNTKIFAKWIECNYGYAFSAKTITVPKMPKKVLRIYNDDEIKEIFKTVTNRTHWIELRNRTIVALMLDSGLRQIEVCTLRKKNVDLIQGIVKVTGKGSKERLVPIGQLTKSCIQDYLKSCPFESAFVFLSLHGDSLTRDAVKHLMYKIGNQLSFDFSSHKLRHNFATNYVLDAYEDSGKVDIYRLMILMGHEDIATTRRYLHLANQIIAVRPGTSHIDRLGVQLKGT